MNPRQEQCPFVQAALHYADRRLGAGSVGATPNPPGPRLGRVRPRPRPDLQDASPGGRRPATGFLTGAELRALVRRTSWLWPGWIANEHLTVLSGEHGSGKSWLALGLARCVIDGQPWPDGQPNEVEPGRVFWLESEGRQSVLIERADDLGLDFDRGMLFIEAPFTIRYLDSPGDFEQVAEAVTAGRPRLLIVDAWSQSLAGSENDADVRFCLDDLQRLARELCLPVVLIHHLRKKHLADYAEGFDFDRLRGSSVLSQMATCVLGVDQPRKGTPHCRVSCGKANLAPLPQPFGFTVTGGFKTGRPASLTFGPAPERPEAATRLDEAKAFLRRALAEGPRPANEVVAEATEDGIAEETLKRAKRQLCGVIRAGGRRPAWLWCLKDEGGEHDDTVGREDTVEERETTVSSLPTVS